MDIVKMKKPIKIAQDRMKLKNKHSRQYPVVLFNITFSMFFLTNYPLQGKNPEWATCRYDMNFIRAFAWKYREELFFNSVNGSIFLDFLFWGFHAFKRGFGFDSPEFMKMSAAFEVLKERIVNPKPQYLQRTYNDRKFRKHLCIGNQLFYKFLVIYLCCIFELNIDLKYYLNFILSPQTTTLEDYKNSLLNAMMTKAKDCIYASSYFCSHYKSLFRTISSGIQSFYRNHQPNNPVLIQFVLGICAKNTVSGKKNTSILRKFPHDLFKLYVMPLYFKKQSYTEFCPDPNIQDIFNELFQ
jgi:hypothetical protein